MKIGARSAAADKRGVLKVTSPEAGPGHAAVFELPAFQFMAGEVGI